MLRIPWNECLFGFPAPLTLLVVAEVEEEESVDVGLVEQLCTLLLDITCGLVSVELSVLLLALSASDSSLSPSTCNTSGGIKQHIHTDMDSYIHNILYAYTKMLVGVYSTLLELLNT